MSKPEAAVQGPIYDAIEEQAVRLGLADLQAESHVARIGEEIHGQPDLGFTNYAFERLEAIDPGAGVYVNLKAHYEIRQAAERAKPSRLKDRLSRIGKHALRGLAGGASFKA